MILSPEILIEIYLSTYLILSQLELLQNYQHTIPHQDSQKINP